VVKRFVAAALEMQADGWWWHDTTLTDQSIKRGIFKEMLTHRF
jgi:glutamate-1-semialdehyde 2,1-aminomutase